MTVGELRAELADLDGLLNIEIIVPYEDEDGDAVERAFDIRSVEKCVDRDTAGEYVRIECGDA